MENLENLKSLVERFAEDFTIYKNGKEFNEQMTRQQYIDNFLKLLGWDISNPRGLSFNDREVVAEEYSNDNRKDRPDYTIRTNGVSRFYVEAKKVSVDIFNDDEPALQARRYGWNSNHRIALLTNFEYLVIYTTYQMPKEGDKASSYRYKYYHYTEYIDKFDEIYSLLSRESVLDGTFDEWTESILPENSRKSSLDSIFLEQLNEWRLQIGQELFESNRYTNTDMVIINEEIQEFLNQIIFLRFAEDNRYESADLLKTDILKMENYLDYFKSLDKKYNSSLFNNVNIISIISSDLLKSIVEGLYFPEVSYDFSIIDLSILSKVYENFLQEELVIEDGEVQLRKTKSASIKAVVSTPDDVVVSMVKRVLSEKIDGKEPEEILSLKIADLAVGSGIFLIEAYNFIEDYLIQWYAKKNAVSPNRLLVPFELKKKIIQEVLVGFDINNQAVQLTRFSLLLRILSREGKERIEKITPILPSLVQNIRCGNSLVSVSDIDVLDLTEEELFEILPISDKVFSEKYDVIIGNPPYLSKKDIINSTNKKEINVYDKAYLSTDKQYDKYLLFVEKSLNAVKENGDIILLIPNKFINIEAGKGLRAILKEKLFVKKIFDFKYTQIFPSVTNYVAVVHLSSSESFEYVEISSANEIYHNKQGLDYRLDELNNEHWFLTSDKRLKQQYEYARENFPSIDTEIIPKNGVQTSRNPVYLISKNKITELDDSIVYEKDGEKYVLEKEILRDFYKPSSTDVGKSYSKLHSDTYIIFPYMNGEIIEEDILSKSYPGVYRYLLNHKNELLPKSMGGKRDVRGAGKDIIWYQFGRAQYLKEVDESKIIVGVMSSEPNFNIDLNNYVYASGGTAGYIGLFLKNESRYSLEYIQAWLSHEFTDRIFQTIGSSFEDEFYTHGTALYKDIPLLPINFDSKDEKQKFDNINRLVQEISAVNNSIEAKDAEKHKEFLLLKKESLIKQVNAIFDELLAMKMR
ncbi:TPA: Eco57I restriction-modification methylase domain-containing protein [Streptococcus suis]|nr:Eco57I restriction-modification methylase domain-containing protein [Streptococcus suis]HEO8607563.1 Eco57I restriction-modification methylase domain-containing protein [Streptococcus suis]HEO8609466.1 Eco57I restriction-modification methylase domain-containing protein [Streptococcus suis]